MSHDSTSDSHENDDSLRERISVLLKRWAESEDFSVEFFHRFRYALAEELDKRGEFTDRPGVTHQENEIATIAHAKSPTPNEALLIHCPHCSAPNNVAVDLPLVDLTCTSCGSNFSLAGEESTTRAASPLTQIGHFELIERIGVGGFGTVWKARDTKLDRSVAVKIPRQGQMSSTETEKFLREARAAAQLKHPNIVAVHEVGRDRDTVFIVSNLVRGLTLDEWLTGQSPGFREVAELCVKIADALHHAHEQGVIHRDLKPSNIMVDVDGEPHLMDFGLARREVGEVTMTIDGQVLGTPAYMSPEQAEGRSHRADRRSDIYSLGAVLFRLLTGELPFRGSARMIMHQVIHDDPASPRSLNAKVPKDLETLTLKCLEKSPAKRYDTANDVAGELRRFLNNEPIKARPIGSLEKAWRTCRRNPSKVLVPSLFLLMLFLLIVGYAYLAVSEQRDLAVNQRQKAEVAQKEALRQKDIAKDQRVIAENARALAEEQQQFAQQQKERAEEAEKQARVVAQEAEARRKEAEDAKELAESQGKRAEEALASVLGQELPTLREKLSNVDSKEGLEELIADFKAKIIQHFGELLRAPKMLGD